MLVALDVKMEAFETLKVTHCLAKQCLSLYFAVGCRCVCVLRGVGVQGVEMSEPLMLETEEEVEVPVDLRCALKVFLYGCSHSSHRC